MSAGGGGLTPKLQPSAEAGTGELPSEGERKTVTFLFADIKGSMELMEDLDPEEARAIIDPALQLMMEAVRHYGGHVAQSTGDGIFALFGAPIAYEDHPQRALYAALGMQEEMRRYSDKLRTEGQSPLTIRVGINTGEVVVRSVRKDESHADYLPVGHSTGLAQRMQALALPGSIVVSEHTHQLCEGYFQFKPLGPTKVKGLSEPIAVFEVLGLGPLRTRLQRSASRGFSRFVGRDREIAQMREALERAKGRHGQVVAAIGEAGVGKSRLFHEFKAIAQSGALILEAVSVSYGKASAFFPVIDLLKGYFRIGVEDDARERREKIGGKVLMLDRALEDTLPYIFGLLDLTEDNTIAPMDPQVKRRRTLEAIKSLILRESRNQPLILIFEDLHWIDSESQAFLDLMVESLANARILLLVNYRPEYRHSWGNKTFYTQLRLNPLGEESAGDMLTSMIGDDPSLNPLKALIAERTQGNPLFMEETVNVLFGRGELIRNGTVKLTTSLGQLRIPPTVQAILASRIDLLPAPEKELLQTLAVIGNEFSLSLVKAVRQEPEEKLGPMLSSLQLAEFILEQPTFPEIEYSFKHALTHDVAYESLLLERRKLIHERAAQATETVFSERLDDHLSDLAHHYARSANSAKAVEYLRRAGQQAENRSAFTEAITHCRSALQRLGSLPDNRERARQELALQITMGRCLSTQKGHASPEAGQAFSRAREFCSQPEDSGDLFEALIGLRAYHMLRIELKEAGEFCDQLLALADRTQDPAMVVEAHRAFSHVLIWRGEFAKGLEHTEQGLAIENYQPKRANFIIGEPQVSCLYFAGYSNWFLGYPDRALRACDRSVAKAEELREPNSIAIGVYVNSQVRYWAGDATGAREKAEAAIAISTEHGLMQWHAYATVMRGCAIADAGEAEAGVAEIRKGLDALRATGAAERTGRLLGMFARALWKAGRAEEGFSIVDEALASVAQTDERMYEAELHRLKGELSLARDSTGQAAAEACFRTAIEIARRQSAKSWELRATTSLARLLAKQGKRHEARAMLTEIYEWFTEGFDTADLKEAKALLEELSG